MGAFRTNDSLRFTEVDGIVINELAPQARVIGVAANIGILVGTSQRGPQELTELTSNTFLKEKFGNDKSKGLYKVLKNKGFGVLKFIRVIAADAFVASKIFKAGLVDIIEFEALSKGVYGNSIKIKIEAGTDALTKKYTISDTNSDKVITDEVYDNVKVALITPTNNPFAKSKLVKATVLATSAEPDVTVGFVALASGDDGTIGDTDYEDAIDLAKQEGAGNVLFLDSYNTARNGYLKAHVAEANDKMVITCGEEADMVGDVTAEVNALRDTDGRIIHAFPYAKTMVDGVEVLQPTAWWVASILTQTHPKIDPASVDNSKYCYGITGLNQPMSRADYVNFVKLGVCAFEYDPDFGFKPKSGIVTQILNSEKVTVLRRRMTDFLTDSLAKFLKNYQNKPNSLSNRTMAAAAITAFDKQLETAGDVPSDAELTGGAKAKIIDFTSLNDNDTIAAGIFNIVYKRRIYSSMRYIVLTTEIGQSVIVKESEA